MCRSTKDFWSSSVSIGSINHTDICLIPKIDKPEFATQFWPISLCNVSYKILIKAFVNRLKPLMPRIVSSYQTGFIPSRSIHENIIVAQEILHSMRLLKRKPWFFVLKVELVKAYDRMRWSFIADIFHEVGIPDKLASVIMHCISLVQSNVM